MFVVATTSAMNDVAHERAGLISGVVNTCHELGASLGVAFIAAAAGASLDVTRIAPDAAAGFDRAFLATGIAAVVAAVAVFAMLPAGRPRPGTVRFGH
jgi:sugar phosphate permease